MVSNKKSFPSSIILSSSNLLLLPKKEAQRDDVVALEREAFVSTRVAKINEDS